MRMKGKNEGREGPSWELRGDRAFPPTFFALPHVRRSYPIIPVSFALTA
jgi:hypothetical protein